jgi:hypothetical protein
MNCQTTIYNAFTGISQWERGALITFLCQFAGNATPYDVQEALDYALKHKPSFGGFIVAIREEQKFLGAIVVNHTGMEGYSPPNIFIYVAIDGAFPQQEEILKHLMQQAITCANGDIAMHIEPDHPALNLYKKMGFRAQYLELRLDKRGAIA